MFLSFIIPCYNCSGTIIRTLESIVTSPEIAIEAILIDDCSTDNTIEVVNNYIISHNWVRLISLTTNQGPANARNVGLDASQGDYIAFIDSDDTISPDYISLVYEAAHIYNADLISIGIQRVFGASIINVPFIDYQDQAEFLALCSGSLCTLVSSKNLWKGLKLPGIRNAEDIAVIPILISRSQKIYYIHHILYNYILSPNSLSRKPRPDVSFNFQKSFEFTCQHVDNNNLFYKSAIEFHGIKTILYGGVLNGIRCNLSTSIIKQMVNDFESDFPKWTNNKYIKKYPFRKRFFLICVKLRLFPIIHLFEYTHELLITRQACNHKSNG